MHGIIRMQKAGEKSLVHEHTTFGHLMQWPKVLTLHGCTAARESGGQFRIAFYVPVSARGTAKSALPARHSTAFLTAMARVAT